MKAFLSHNSLDKDFVESVFKELTGARAVFDAKSFEKNCDLTTEIRDGMHGCDMYVLFVSKGALQSGWVRNEIDIAAELKTKGALSNFLVFQLDDTHWSELPEWMRRYVVGCPPSPHQVASRIKDEFHKKPAYSEGCYGRDDAVKEITSAILDRDHAPSFLFLSGPTGIGRRTVAREVFRTLYDGISKHFIEVQYEEFFDVVSLHRKLLQFSANWQARAFAEESARFAALSETERLIDLGKLIQQITIDYSQVLVLDLGAHAFDATEKMNVWLTSLMEVLPESHMPYLIFISSRAADGYNYENGIFYAVDPLDSENSMYLFKVLINKHKISLPSKEEKDVIQKSVVGHPGLIAKVVNYLRTNPKYKPNKTHNNVVALIRSEIEKMLKDFIGIDAQLRPVVGLFGEANIISYNEMIQIDTIWPNFLSTTERLIDAGFLQGVDGYYQLSSYLQRYSQKLAEECSDAISPARNLLFSSAGDIEQDTFVPINLLDSRIVEYFTMNVAVPGYLKNLIMPVQQLKAAKRRYDNQDYKRALVLAKDAYDQSTKLSVDGILEAWRLIGLSAVREKNVEMFEFFMSELPKIPPSVKRDGLFYFAQGFKARTEGDLRNALNYFRKVEKSGFEDAHLHREISYIHSFDGIYDDAIRHSKKALKLSPLSAYVLDIQVWALIQNYRVTKDPHMPLEIENSLLSLKDADIRDGTRFYTIRELMKQIIVDQSPSAISDAYNMRDKLPIHVKISLLEMLSIKGKNTLYDTLCSEIEKTLKSKKSPLAEIEFAKIRIIHFAYNGKKIEATNLLTKYSRRFTNSSESSLIKIIESSRAH